MTSEIGNAIAEMRGDIAGIGLKIDRLEAKLDRLAGDVRLALGLAQSALRAVEALADHHLKLSDRVNPGAGDLSRK